MANLLVWLSPWTFLRFHMESMCKATWLLNCQSPHPICLYWLILFSLLLKRSLLDTPSNPSLITTLLLANTKYWFNTTFPGLLSALGSGPPAGPPPNTHTQSTLQFPFSNQRKQAYHLYTASISTAQQCRSHYFHVSKAYQRHHFSRPGSWLSPLAKPLISSRICALYESLLSSSETRGFVSCHCRLRLCSSPSKSPVAFIA